MISIQDKINIEISKQIKVLKDEVKELKEVLKEQKDIGGLVKEYLLIGEEEMEDRVIENMINKGRGK